MPAVIGTCVLEMTGTNHIIRNASRSRSRRRRIRDTQREQYTQVLYEIRLQLFELDSSIRDLTREFQLARRTEPIQAARESDCESPQLDRLLEERTEDPLSSLSSE